MARPQPQSSDFDKVLRKKHALESLAPRLDLRSFLSVLNRKGPSIAIAEDRERPSRALKGPPTEPALFLKSLCHQLARVQPIGKPMLRLKQVHSAYRATQYKAFILPHALLSKPFASSVDGELSRSDALERARSALNEDRARDAERIADELLKVNARDAFAHRIRGAALLMQARANDAVPALENAARALRDAETDTLLAMALRLSGRLEDALSRLKRSIKRLPPYAPAFHEFAGVLMSLGRYEEAMEVLRRGLEIAPMTPQLSVQLGELFLRRRDYIQAKMTFANALEIAADSPDALFGIGRAHHALGEKVLAADSYRRCLRVQPDHTAAWLNLGNCLLQICDTEAGYECFRAAARHDAKSYGIALSSLAAAGRGRLWLKPSAATRFLVGKR